MDIWEKLYESARKEYHPTDVTPYWWGWRRYREAGLID